MKAINFPEASRFLGRPASMSQDECDAAPIAVGIYLDKYPTVITCWEPTEEERQAIAEGANIYLHLLGSGMQPAMLSTKVEVETIAGTN